MENRGKKECKDRNLTEIIKIKRTVGIYIHLDRKANVSHPLGFVLVCVYIVLWWWLYSQTWLEFLCFVFCLRGMLKMLSVLKV